MFLLVRHGSVNYDAYPNRFRGHGIDLLPLTASGAVEAEGLASRLAEQGGVDLIVASPMTRALQTAMILSWELTCPVEVELDLHEWVPDTSQQWTDGEVPRTAYEELLACGGEWPPGEQREWEPYSAVRRRVGTVLERYSHLTSVAVVTHSGVIEAMTGVSGIEPCGMVCFEPTDKRLS